MEEEGKKWMTVSLGTSLALEVICLFVASVGRHNLVSGTQNDIVVSCITL